jgi:hypothetical protein
LCEISDFAGDDGEATSRFAGPCRLHCCVQGQDIGLESDSVDAIDDLGIFLLSAAIASIVATTCPTTSPPLPAAALAENG